MMHHTTLGTYGQGLDPDRDGYVPERVSDWDSIDLGSRRDWVEHWGPEGCDTIPRWATIRRGGRWAQLRDAWREHVRESATKVRSACAKIDAWREANC